MFHLSLTCQMAFTVAIIWLEFTKMIPLKLHLVLEPGNCISCDFSAVRSSCVLLEHLLWIG